MNYRGTKLFFVADLIPSTAHIPLIWNMSYELDPLKTIQEKEAIIKEALQNQYALFFQHDYYNECCTLKETPKGIRVERTLSLKELIAEKAEWKG